MFIIAKAIDTTSIRPHKFIYLFYRFAARSFRKCQKKIDILIISFEFFCVVDLFISKLK